MTKPNKKQKKNPAYFFNELAYAFNSTFRIDANYVMLEEYQKARDVRNRITHPKKPSDLDVTVDEYKDIIIPAYRWFAENLGKLLKSKQS